MILKKIISICKTRGIFELYDDGDRQWLSDGSSIFLMNGVPYFDMDSLLATFDISGKKKEKLLTQHFFNLPERISFDDTYEGESLCEVNPIKMNINATTYIQLLTSTGCEFIDDKYLSPLSDTNEDMLRIYERMTNEGQTYFAVKDGLLLIGVIFPTVLINQKTLEELKLFVQRCEVHMNNNQRKKR